MGHKKKCSKIHKKETKEERQFSNLEDRKDWMKAWVDNTDDFLTLLKVFTVMRTLDEMNE